MKIGLGFLGRGEGSGKTEGFAATCPSAINLLKTLIFSIFFLVSFLFTGRVAEAAITPGDPNNFITVWDTSKPGVSNNKQITIPGTDGGYNYDIYWEDTASSSVNGTILGVNTNTRTITFPATGVYRVEIAGSFPRIYFYHWSSSDARKIIDIEQWGNIAWTSFDRAFYGAYNLHILAVDAPNLSNVSTMKSAFNYNSNLNESINHWNTSNVSIMSNLFYGNTYFNQPLNNWNVSNVIDMGYVFSRATSFNQPLNSWNTASTTNMNNMFSYASAFNQPLNSWNTASATDMSDMFRNATAFDQDLSSWDISSVTTMSSMLSGTSLSQANQDATLVSWATQATNKNITGIPLHIGVANYSATGSAAIQTLRGLGWTIDEQHSVKYKVQAPATFNIPFYANQIVASGTNASAITVTYNSDICTFLGWSDGRKDNPRQDLAVTENIEVEALLSCSSRPTVVTQSITEEISLTVPSLVTLSPDIPGISGGTSSGSLPINIKTNNLLGFNATLAFSTSTALRHKVDNNYFVNNYVPVSSTTPDYDFNLRTNPHGFAFSIHGDDVTTLFKNNGSVCGLGTLSTLGHCWFNQSNATTPLSILKRSSPSPSGGATSTVSFRLDVAPDPTPALKGGVYEGVAVITVLPGV